MLGRMATTDPVAYLRATPPFSGLRPEAFEAAVRDVEVVYEPAEAARARRGRAARAPVGDPEGRRAARARRPDATGPRGGEIFGYTSLATGEATLEVVVEEDLVAYRLPGAAFRALLGEAGFAGHFAAGLAERLRASLEQSPVATFRRTCPAQWGSSVRRPASLGGGRHRGRCRRAR